MFTIVTRYAVSRRKTKQLKMKVNMFSVTVVEETQPRKRSEAERSDTGERCALLRLRVHEGESIPINER